MPFITTIEVRFGDCDPAGIVYYPVLFHYCHVAFESSWQGALGIRYPDLISVERVGFPTVHVETDFRSPARYGDAVDFEVSVSRLGTTSVVYLFEATVEGRSVLHSAHTKVCLNLDTFEKMPIPATLRGALERLVG